MGVGGMTHSQVTIVVPGGFEARQSGVSSFLRTVIPRWSAAHPTWRIVHQDVALVPGGEINENPVPSRRKRSSRPSPLRLVLGYFSEYRANVRWLLRHVDRDFEGTVVLNTFGCEVLPISARYALPKARIICIAHTRPGEDERGSHWIRRKVERLCARSAHGVVFHSVSARDSWERKIERSFEQSWVIGHGVGDVPLEVPESLHRSDGETRLDVVCVTRMVPGKGLQELLSVWKNLLPRAPRAARLVLVGDGPLRTALEEEVSVWGADADRVLFTGVMEAGARAYNKAVAGVLLATEEEAFGLTVVEAMACGTPVVVSNRGALPELVADGGGVVVDVADQSTVANHLLALLADHVRRAEMGKAAREVWRKTFSVTKMLDEYKRVFEGDA